MTALIIWTGFWMLAGGILGYLIGKTTAEEAAMNCPYQGVNSPQYRNPRNKL